MSTDEIYNAIIADRLPERYAFEFSPWEEILSWNLAGSRVLPDMALNIVLLAFCGR